MSNCAVCKINKQPNQVDKTESSENLVLSTKEHHSELKLLKNDRKQKTFEQTCRN